VPEEILMKKRWGVRVVAFLMLIAGLLLFLLGIVPAILVAVRGAGMGLGAWLAIPSALAGCAGALFLLLGGSVLLTIGKIAESTAAPGRPAPSGKAAPAVPSVVVAEEPVPASTAAALPAVAVAPVAEAALVEPVAAVAEKIAAPQEAAPETEVPAAEIAAEVPEPQPAAAPSPQEEVSALQAQLDALQAQLDELEGVPPAGEELPAVLEDEGPAPGATEELKLPGASEAARVAAEMAALETAS
jgi:hypothetical protein